MTHSSNPTVSVLLPTYNYAHFLDEAIQSLLSQSFTDWELVVVDDKSTDETDQVMQPYLKDKRIRYIKNERNLGLVGNFNKCLEYARGEFIKYLLADDRLHPEQLQKFVQVMERHPSVVLVTSERQAFGKVNKKLDPPLKGLQDGKTVILESLKEGGGNWIGEPTTVMFRRNVLEKVGNFNPDYVCLVDWDLWLRILTTGDCYIIPEILSFFRLHDNQVSRKVTLNFDFTFEEYRFYRNNQQYNPYQINLREANLEPVVRKRATYCAHAFLNVLPKIHRKGNWEIMKTALDIAVKEKVLGRAVFDYARALRRKIRSA